MRGMTLIELMVAVAIIGIGSTTFYAATKPQVERAADAVLHERALQLLEAEAEAVVSGRAPDPAVRARLSGELPGANLVALPGADGLTTFTVAWTGADGGPRKLSLAVLGRKP